MKKTWISLMLAVLMLLSAVGCGVSVESQEPA